MENYAIIVAGGKGQRMGTDIPKQFLPVGGTPILMRTIQRFHAYDPHLKIILVLPKEQQDYWKALCKQYAFKEKYMLADGGSTRFQSSRNGIALIPEGTEGLVAIHDGVRPFVSIGTIKRCFDAAEEAYAAIPVLHVTDTLRYIDSNGGGKNVQRSDYRLVQTPQVFDITLVKKAYEQEENGGFTDDASVVERLGCQVEMVEGNRENIKLTTPFDLRLAEVLCRSEQ